MALAFCSPASWCSLVIAIGMVHLASAVDFEEYFAIRAIASGKCATFTNKSGILVDCDGSQNQLFYSENDQIKSDPNTCLTADDSEMLLRACDGSAEQKWSYSHQQLRLTETSVPDDSCVLYQTDTAGQSTIRYYGLTGICSEGTSIYSRTLWDRFYIKAFQSMNQTFQVLPNDSLGCLVAASSNGPVDFKAACSQASHALFDQSWYFDGTHIRNLGFYSGACMEPAADHFGIQISECVGSDTQKWYFSDGVFRNGMNGTQGDPQCLTIRTSSDFKPYIATCGGRGEKKEQQLRKRATQWNIQVQADKNLPFEIHP